MLKLILEIVTDVARRYHAKPFMLLLLMILVGIAEGVGFSLILPLLNLAGIGEGEQSAIAIYLRKSLAFIGVEFEIKRLLGLIMAVFFVQNVLFLFQSWLLARLQNEYVTKLREELFSGYMNAGWPFFVEAQSGHLINVLIGETSRIGGAFYLLAQFFSAIIVTFVYIFLSLYISWEITVLILVAGTVIAILTRGLAMKGYAIGKDMSFYSSQFQSLANEFIGGAKTIKSTSTELYATSRFSNIAKKLGDLYFWSSFHPNILRSIFEFSGIVLLCSVLYIGTHRMLIDPAVVIVVVALFVRLIPRMFGLQQNLQLIGVYVPSIRTITECAKMSLSYKEKTELIKASGERLDEPIAISLKNVSVSLGDKEILRDISLDIPPMKTIGIVGSSGSGKSTLVDCLLRFYVPEKGVIEVNGKSLRSIPLQTWRKSVGYVSQDTHLFHDSIKNNIAWGATHLAESDITTAAERAYIHNFIVGLKEGYSTAVGDRGVRLSGGEKQRICLARALVNRPSLLILDEATSALDAESEKYVLSAIEQLRGQITIVMVAHRLSTVKNTDYIYVLEKGMIVEHGTFSRLSEQNKRFKYLLDLQKSIVE